MTKFIHTQEELLAIVEQLRKSRGAQVRDICDFSEAQYYRALKGETRLTLEKALNCARGVGLEMMVGD